MSFKISNIEHYLSPCELKVDEILKAYGTSFSEIDKIMKGAEFVYLNRDKGFQIELAKQLKTILEKHFQKLGGRLYQGAIYSPTIDLKPDVAVGLKEHPKKIFIEIEFRPNECKDIVKFLIGYKKKTLELGLLIVPVDRKTICKYSPKGYNTMTEFRKCKQIVEELQSDCPMWVMGFEGEWISAE